MKMKFLAASLILLLTTVYTKAQQEQTTQQKADTVIIPLANKSKVIFIVGDREDLKTIKHYDFDELFEDIIQKIESNDTSKVVTVSRDTTMIIREVIRLEDKDGKNDEDDRHYRGKHYGHRHGKDDENKNKVGRTWQSTNVDLGINNYVSSNGNFPDGNELYAVRPWGSWYVGVNSIQRTKLAKHFLLEWGLGASWYNFKFEQDNLIVDRNEFGVTFNEDLRDVDHIKSKLTASYINVSLIPVLDLGERGKKTRWWDDYDSEFRFGVGPYAGYRIGSKSKHVFEEDGHLIKDKIRNNFNLNNFRYGIRAQLGIRSTDFFLNYDLNDLFQANKGPKLNAISFGVIF